MEKSVNVFSIKDLGIRYKGFNIHYIKDPEYSTSITQWYLISDYVPQHLGTVGDLPSKDKEKIISKIFGK